jgi:hypothetical protein
MVITTGRSETKRRPSEGNLCPLARGLKNMSLKSRDSSFRGVMSRTLMAPRYGHRKALLWMGVMKRLLSYYVQSLEDDCNN